MVQELGGRAESCYLVTVELDPEKSVKHPPGPTRTMLIGPTVLSQRLDWNDSWADVPQLPDPWINEESLLALSEESEAHSEVLLEIFSKCLSGLTALNWDKRSWRILLGPWMKSYAFAYQEKVQRLNLQARSFKIKSISESPIQDFQVNDMDDWVSMTLSFELHSYLFQEAARPLGILPRKESACSHPSSARERSMIERRPLGARVLRTLAGVNRGAAIFFYKTYLPRTIEFKFALELGQWPIPFTTAPASSGCPDHHMRDALLEKIGEVTAEMSPDLQNSSLVAAKLLPRAYLENLMHNLALSREQGWPVSPKVVFDSNGYWADEVFKVYTAEKVAQGSKLVIGQHGGMMGTALWHSQQDHQINIADKFFTWGWKLPNEDKTLPVGVIKSQPKSRPRLKGSAVMPLLSLPKYPYDNCAFPIGQSGWLRYFRDQTVFLQSLKYLSESDIVLRGYAKDRGNFMRERLRRLGWTNLEIGSRPLSFDLKDYRIAIITYNSTTILETLGANFPTIAFWDHSSWKLKPEVETVFARLESVGILFRSPEDAAHKLEQVWKDVNSWWFSSEVQLARNEFVQNFAQELNSTLLLETLVSLRSS